MARNHDNDEGEEIQWERGIAEILDDSCGHGEQTISVWPCAVLYLPNIAAPSGWVSQSIYPDLSGLAVESQRRMGFRPPEPHVRPGRRRRKGSDRDGSIAAVASGPTAGPGHYPVATRRRPLTGKKEKNPWKRS